MLNIEEAYQTYFCEYPDVVNITQLCEMLGGIGKKMGYHLLHSGKIRYFTIGRHFRIAKMDVIEFLEMAKTSGK